MERKKTRVREHSYGTLPPRAPLANPYVPMQSDDPMRYEERKAFIRGTLYPGLDLPFRGMVNNTEKPVTPKTQVQALGFALQELSLYLDTHPHDMRALEQYRQYQQAFNKSVEAYGQNVMPINHTQSGDGQQYCWLRDPWPWEYAANKEG